MTVKPVPVDERFRQDLDESYEALMTVVRNALESKKRIRVFADCDKCGCKHAHYVEVDNTDAAMKAVEFLSNRGVGRPGTVEVGEREVVHSYELQWVRPEGSDDDLGGSAAAGVATVGGKA